MPKGVGLLAKCPAFWSESACGAIFRAVTQQGGVLSYPPILLYQRKFFTLVYRILSVFLLCQRSMGNKDPSSQAPQLTWLGVERTKGLYLIN